MNKAQEKEGYEQALEILNSEKENVLDEISSLENLLGVIEKKIEKFERQKEKEAQKC